MFQKKEKDPTTKTFDDGEWIQSLTEAQEIAADIRADRLSHDQSEADLERSVPSRWESFCQNMLTRRLQALSEGEITVFTAAMRQVGLGSQGQGGAEALAIFHQLIFQESASGTLDTPIARIKVDECNCFGAAVRNSASFFLPKHAAVAGWTHRALFYVEQGVQPMPKDRGAEQGDVDGP